MKNKEKYSLNNKFTLGTPYSFEQLNCTQHACRYGDT